MLKYSYCWAKARRKHCTKVMKIPGLRKILKEEELVPAMGCTEPIAIAYAGAVARKTLGNLPEQLDIKESGNIIKNVKASSFPIQAA